jgi:hypothetical protein
MEDVMPKITLTKKKIDSIKFADIAIVPSRETKLSLFASAVSTNARFPQTSQHPVYNALRQRHLPFGLSLSGKKNRMNDMHVSTRSPA